MLTGVILVKNEENNIVDAVESLNFCDQILIIDDDSTDRTQEILKVLRYQHKHLKVFSRELNADFSSQRNFALSKSENEWVLFLDADERLTTDLRKEIQDAVRVREVNGFFVKRNDFMWGKELKHGETGDIWLLRLGKKSQGRWEGKVHERWEIKGKTQKLGSTISHYPHQSLTQFLKEINFYTSLRAKELYKEGKKANAVSVILYPKAKFFINYFIKAGFLDGVPGFVVNVLMSFHSFLVRGKLWQLSRD